MAKSLPWEVIVDIFCRLPVKALLLFRRVSKPWCSLIEGSDFICLHLNHSNETNTNLAAVLFRDNDLASFDLDSLGPAVKLDHPIDDGHEVEVLGSCNGLLALLNSLNDVVILNPSTRSYRKLPSCNVVSPFFMQHLIFYGFGYDSVKDDYKVVMLIHTGNSFHHEASRRPC